jgi:hypothetical protein
MLFKKITTTDNIIIMVDPSEIIKKADETPISAGLVQVGQAYIFTYPKTAKTVTSISDFYGDL